MPAKVGELAVLSSTLPILFTSLALVCQQCMHNYYNTVRTYILKYGCRHVTLHTYIYAQIMMYMHVFIHSA